MKNTIVERIIDFLKNYPPFYLLEYQDLIKVAYEVKVIYFEKDEIIFKKNDIPKNYFYVVKDGAVGIYDDNNLVDKCDEGDLFGLRALMQKDNYILDAKSIEESIIYTISSAILAEVIDKNKAVKSYLFASFISNKRYQSIHDFDERFQQNHSSIYTEIQSANFSKNPITCFEHTKIKEAASIMQTNNIGSLVVVKDQYTVGIITDKDLRNKVATGVIAITEEVAKIMSSPVFTYPPKISVAEAQIAMLQNKISHLCITKDGTVNSKVIGILSEHDLVVMLSNNPTAFIKEIKRSKSAEKLKEIKEKSQQLLNNYITQKIPIPFITTIFSEINKTITQQIIQLSLSEIKEKNSCAFTWLALGSQGRQEQLLLTDQDNALIFEDSKSNSKNKDYFLQLSKSINHKLAIVGYKLCPAEMMASNPKWCLTISQWKEQFNNWITNPTEEKILLCTIFFDYALVYGKHELLDELTNSIFNAIDSYPIFLNFLARNAMKNPPPLSFFRNFLVEDSGEHKDKFDIKARAIMPLADAARVLILSHKIKEVNSTIARFKKLGELEPQNKFLYDKYALSFTILVEFRTTQGLKNNNSGRFIAIDHLTKANRLQLKSCFKPIKEIQELISTRFQLAQIM
ncbi:DUF294 nucleotidyltransferase-like domain-containing protein [Polaribacter sp.]|uniref:DUF294 nucleotidyltransferase-like domain-containing protein n=1 Tax=Polaribacter sp. TaxID=1920175 RepID=UPI003F695797